MASEKDRLIDLLQVIVLAVEMEDAVALEVAKMQIVFMFSQKMAAAA